MERSTSAGRVSSAFLARWAGRLYQARLVNSAKLATHHIGPRLVVRPPIIGRADSTPPVVARRHAPSFAVEALAQTTHARSVDTHLIVCVGCPQLVLVAQCHSFDLLANLVECH